MYASDTKKRYIHIYYSAAKAVGERARLEEKIHEMQRFMEQHEDKEYEFGPAFHKYFHMHYNKGNGHFVYGEPRLPVIRDELELCGYFAIISSERMDAKDAINLYKSRDVSEKVFRADKSYLGNHCLRVASEEATSNKIFIGFLALIIRCRIYTALKEKAKELAKKRIITVPAAIRELEKIEMTRQLDKVYRLEHAVTKTQEVYFDEISNEMPTEFEVYFRQGKNEYHLIVTEGTEESIQLLSHKKFSDIIILNIKMID